MIKALLNYLGFWKPGQSIADAEIMVSPETNGFVPNDLISAIPRHHELAARLYANAINGSAERKILQSGIPPVLFSEITKGMKVAAVGERALPVIKPAISGKGAELAYWLAPAPSGDSGGRSVKGDLAMPFSPARLAPNLPFNDVLFCTSPDISGLILYGKDELERIAERISTAFIFPIATADNAVAAAWGQGFSTVEELHGSHWRWCNSAVSRGEITVFSRSLTNLTARLRADVLHAPGWNGLCYCISPDKNTHKARRESFDFKFQLAPGPNRFIFGGDTPPVPIANDIRRLCFGISALRVEDSARDSISGIQAYMPDLISEACFLPELIEDRLRRSGFVSVSKVGDSERLKTAYGHCWYVARRLPE